MAFSDIVTAMRNRFTQPEVYRKGDH